MTVRFISDGIGLCVGLDHIAHTNKFNLCRRCWKRTRDDPAFRARVEANPRSGLGD